MDLSVIIVNYQARELLLECLAALVPDLAPLASEIVVVDNDPADGAPRVLAERFPAVRVIVNAENVGYGRAATVAGAPSRESLSTTTISDSMRERSRARAARHSRSRSRAL